MKASNSGSSGMKQGPSQSSQGVYHQLSPPERKKPPQTSIAQALSRSLSGRAQQVVQSPSRPSNKLMFFHPQQQQTQQLDSGRSPMNVGTDVRPVIGAGAGGAPPETMTMTMTIASQEKAAAPAKPKTTSMTSMTSMNSTLHQTTLPSQLQIAKMPSASSTKPMIGKSNGAAALQLQSLAAAREAIANSTLGPQATAGPQHRKAGSNLFHQGDSVAANQRASSRASTNFQLQRKAISRELSPASNNYEMASSQMARPASRSGKNIVTLSGESRCTKKSQKSLKLRWNAEDDSSLPVQSSKRQFRSKDVRPVVRSGQQFTQVNLKLKGNFIGKNASKQSKAVMQSLGASNSGRQMMLSPKTQGSQKPKFFGNQTVAGTDSTGKLLSLRQKVMQNENFEMVEARRQAAETYHPEKMQAQADGQGAVTAFIDRYIDDERDQIPGNSQEMHISSSPPRQNHNSLTTQSQQEASIAPFNEKFKEGQRRQSVRPVTTTPILDFRSTQMPKNEESNSETSLGRAIQLDKQTFPMMPLLPPQASMTAVFDPRQTAPVSADQERLRLESKIQKLKQAKAEIEKANSNQKHQEAQSRPSSAAAASFGKNRFLSENRTRQGARISLRSTDSSPEQIQRQSTVEQNFSPENNHRSLDLMAQVRQDLDYQPEQVVTLDPKSNMVASPQKALDERQLYKPISHEQVLQRVAMGPSESFAEEERCSPRETSINVTHNISALNFSNNNVVMGISPGSNHQSQLQQARNNNLPFAFNGLQRENYEILIGEKKRREKNRRHTTQLRNHHHARNHSELLQAQFKKEGSFDVGLTGQECNQNDKFNVDGNDGVGDITSSSDGLARSAVIQGPKSVVFQPLEDGKDDDVDTSGQRMEGNSLGGCEMDEDNGTGQHLEQQISSHTIGGRSQPAKTYVLRRDQFQRNSEVYFLEKDSSQERHYTASGMFRNRLERTPEERGSNTLNSKVHYQQCMPSSYTNFENAGSHKETDLMRSAASRTAQNKAPLRNEAFNERGGMQLQGQNDPYPLYNQHLQNQSEEVEPGDELEANAIVVSSSNPTQLVQSASSGSQLVPATMAKRKKQPSEHSIAQDFLSSGKTLPLLSMLDNNNDRIHSQGRGSQASACIDDTSQILSRITVKNLARVAPGTTNHYGVAVSTQSQAQQQQNKDQKQQIRTLSANNRSDHFSESQVITRVGLHANFNQSTGGRDESSDYRCKLFSQENVLESDRMIMGRSKQPNITEVNLQRGSQDTQDDFTILPAQSQSKTDNKGHRYNRSALSNSNKGDKSQQSTFLSPMQTQQQITANSLLAQSQQETLGAQGSHHQPPQQMIVDVGGTASELNFSQNRLSHRLVTTSCDWQNNAAESGGAEHSGVVERHDVLSNQYLMSSIGNIGEDPAGVCMYEMREFMQEPGASKQINAQKSYQQMMQQQRRMRGQASRNLEVQQYASNEVFEPAAEDKTSSSRHTMMLTGQKHAQKRQKSLVSVGRVSDAGSALDSTMPQDFKIIENEISGEVKLKILRRDTQYVPREVLQDATIFRQVTVLDICNCRIVELEGRIFSKLQNLTKLLAARNQIKYLSGRISECEFLTHINLECNLLEMIPSEIGQLKNSLLVLKLTQNKLKKLTLSTRELTKLEILSISDNCLSELPDGMEDLQNLTELQLSGNSLACFNVMIGRMPKLSKISLDWFQFLMPPLPVLAQRTSQFDVELVMHDLMLANRMSNNLSSIVSTGLKAQISIDNHQIGSSRSRHEVIANGESLTSTIVQQPTGLAISKLESIFSDDDEGLYLIASERANQPVAGLTAQLAHHSNQRLDVFKELAILIEENCSRSPLKKKRYGMGYGSGQKSNSNNNVGESGVDFMSFAEHFYKKAHAERLPADWLSLSDSKSRTMLHYAAQKGDLHAIRSLIEKGSDKTKIDQYSFNVYGLALREEHFSAAMYLLTTPSFAYFDVYQGAGTFGSLLHLAVTKLQPEQVSVFLKHEVSPNTVDQVSGDTPVHSLMSLYHKAPETAKQILLCLHEFGADFNAKNRDNWSPFHLAVKRGNLTALKDMLEIAGNKTQKSWLVQKSQSADLVDIDALGGHNNVSALHLAGEHNFYDIIDLLFQYKADLFVQDDRGNTPFTSITNNLLMIKLIKKEQRAYCNEQFKPQRLQAKELHLTNVIFVKQALREHGVADPILARHMNGRYQTLTSTLHSVQKSLQLPIQARQQRTAFKSYKKSYYANGSVTPQKNGDFTVSAEKTATELLAENPGKGIDADDDCFTLASEDLNENKGLPQKTSMRAASPSPGSLSQLSCMAFTAGKRRASNALGRTQHMFDRPNMAPNLQAYHGSAKQIQPRRTNSPEFVAQKNNSTSASKPLPSSAAEKSRLKDMKHDSNDLINLKSLIDRKLSALNNSESPSSLLQPAGSGPTPVFACAPKNSMNNDSMDYQLLETSQEQPSQQQVLLKPMTASSLLTHNLLISASETKGVKEGASQAKGDQSQNVGRLSNASSKMMKKGEKLSQKILQRDLELTVQTNSITSPVNAAQVASLMFNNQKRQERKPTLRAEDTIDVEAEEMDYDTIELKESNICASQMLCKQKDLIVKLKVDQQLKHQILKKQQLKVSQHEKRFSKQDASQIVENNNVFDGFRSPPKRQASAKAPMQRRTAPNEATPEDGNLAFNASKNLFGSESQKLTRTSNIVRKSTQAIEPSFMMGHWYKNRASPPPGATREQKLRDQKNVNILSQSLRPRPKQQTSQPVPVKASAAAAVSSKPLMIAPQNIFFKEVAVEDSASKAQAKRDLQVISQRQAAHLKSLVSPTAVVDDDLPYVAIEMPEHQPTKMGNVSTEPAAYQSEGRLNSLNSRQSMTSSAKKRSALEQILNRNYRMGAVGTNSSDKSSLQDINSVRKTSTKQVQIAQKAFLSSANQQQPASGAPDKQKYVSPHQTAAGNGMVGRSQSHQKYSSPKGRLGKEPAPPQAHQGSLLSSDRQRQTQPVLFMGKTQTVPQKPRLQFKQFAVSDSSKAILHKYVPQQQLAGSGNGVMPPSQLKNESHSQTRVRSLQTALLSSQSRQSQAVPQKQQNQQYYASTAITGPARASAVAGSAKNAQSSLLAARSHGINPAM